MKTGPLVFGCLVLAMAIALVTKPSFTQQYTIVWLIVRVLLIGAVGCYIAMAVFLVKFLASARIDRQLRKKGLPVDDSEGIDHL